MEKRINMGGRVDLTGQRFGRLIVLSRLAEKRNGKTRYVCLCDCGNTVNINHGNLTSKGTKSCGCLQKEHIANLNKGKKNNRLPYGESSFRDVYEYYRRNSIVKNREFSLSVEYFRKITKKDCFYCGLPPSNVHKIPQANGEYIYSGVDRVNNDKGYTVDNCVPCCKTCNTAKRVMGYKEFIEWVIRIYGHIQKNRLYEFERIFLMLSAKEDNEFTQD